MNTPPTVAVVAAGAMGAAVGARLHGSGARVITALEGRSPATVRRAEAAGMIGASDDELATADIVLSIVPPNQALPLASRFAESIRRVGTAPVYVDCNAINPATTREVADALAGSGASFVDGSIIGFPPKPEGGGPTFYLAGEHAQAAAELSRFGLNTSTLPGGVGAASALKMSYAGLTKGLLALGTAMLLAADRAGVAEALRAEMASSQAELLARFGRGLPDMLPKAYRWVPEMKEIAGFLGADDPAAPIYRAIALLYEDVARDYAAGGDIEGRLLSFFAAPADA